MMMDVDIIVDEEVEAGIRGVLYVASKQKSDIFIDSDIVVYGWITVNNSCRCAIIG